MNRENIIQMARQAGSLIEAVQEKDLQWLERFAALVASAERRECEKIIWNADSWIGSDAKIWLVKSIQEARGQA